MDWRRLGSKTASECSHSTLTDESKKWEAHASNLFLQLYLIFAFGQLKHGTLRLERAPQLYPSLVSTGFAEEMMRVFATCVLFLSISPAQAGPGTRDPISPL